MASNSSLQKRLLPNTDKDWDKTIPVAIGPNWLRGTRFKVNSAGDSVEPTALLAFNRYLTAAEKWRERKGSKVEKGTRSLRATALECVISSMPWIEGIEGLPRSLIEQLWGEFNRRSIMSLHAWKVLSKALYPAERVNMLRYRQTIRNPKGDLQVYLDPLTSKTFNFIAALTITVEFPIAELMKLPGMKNLGVLHMVRPRRMLGPYYAIPHKRKSDVSDTLVRAWSRAATEDGAFPVLRILRLWNYEDVTDVSFRYISCFPELKIFDICGCGFVDDRPAADIASKLGWRKCSEDPLADLDDLCFEKSLNSKRHLAQRIPQRRESVPFWPGLKVHRLQREKVQDFLSCPPIKIRRDPHILPDGTEYISQEDNHWASLDWRLFCNKGDIRDHDFINYMTWNRIGELLDDSDLIQAGVTGIEEQAFVGSQVITPIPMASVLLGCAKPVDIGPLTSYAGLRGDDDAYIDSNPSKPGVQCKDPLVFFRVSEPELSTVQAPVIADVRDNSRPERNRRRAKRSRCESLRRTQELFRLIISATGGRQTNRTM